VTSRSVPCTLFPPLLSTFLANLLCSSPFSLSSEAWRLKRACARLSPSPFHLLCRRPPLPSVFLNFFFTRRVYFLIGWVGARSRQSAPPSFCHSAFLPARSPSPLLPFLLVGTTLHSFFMPNDIEIQHGSELLLCFRDLQPPSALALGFRPLSLVDFF